MKGWILTLQGLAVIIQVSIHAIEDRVHSVGGAPRDYKNRVVTIVFLFVTLFLSRS